MKYSVRGILRNIDEEEVVEILNTYNLWRLHTGQYTNENSQDEFTFEVWLNTIEEKTSLFDRLKSYVDTHGEQIDWHECTHDEEISRPCVIAEEYRGE